MVGDAQDVRRWQLVKQYAAAARSCEERAIAARTPQHERAQLLERARQLHAQAYHLTA